LIPLDQRDKFPLDKINIRPPTTPAVLSMACIGLRDLVSSLDLIPVKKLFCKFDISGDSREPITTGKHPVKGGSSNIFEVITVDVDVPLDIEYAPVLTIYVYDQLMGFLGERLVGVANIPLEKYCRKVIKHYNEVTDAFRNSEKSSAMV
jgi:hypothetical protein